MTLVVDVDPGFACSAILTIFAVLGTLLCHQRGRRQGETRSGPTTPSDHPAEREDASQEEEGEASPSSGGTNQETQTDRPAPSPPPPFEDISEIWVSGAGERFHFNRDCYGLRAARQRLSKTRCKLCG